MKKILQLGTLFILLVSLNKTSAAQGCSSFDYVVENNGITFSPLYPFYSTFGGNPQWTISMPSYPTYYVQGSDATISSNLLGQYGIWGLQVCFTWGEGNLDCFNETCQSYTYDIQSGNLIPEGQTICNASFEAVVSPNGVVEFINTSTHNGTSVIYQWLPGDQSLGSDGVNFVHQYDYSGPINVCLSMSVYEGDAIVCTDEICQTIEIPEQAANCEPGSFPFSIDLVTCCEADFANAAVFTIFGTEFAFDIQSITTTTFPATYNYTTCLPTGCYEIAFDYSQMNQMVQQTESITYGSPNMTNLQIIDEFEGLPWTSTFCIEPLSTNCPESISAEQIDCDSYVFHVEGVDGGEVHWNFGDNVSETSGPNADHSFAENGTYIVSAEYFSAACPDGVNLIFTVQVDCAVTNNCPDNIWSGVGENCSVRNFEIGNYVEGESVTWFPGDETGAVVGGHFFSHTYAEPGSYTVCAFYTSPLCPQGVELCTNIFVENCNEPICPQYLEAQQIDCNSFVFQVAGVNGGEVSWNFGDNSSENSGSAADHSFENNGVYVVTANYFSSACPNGVSLNYTVEVNCETGNECPTQIWSGAGNGCGVFNFEIGNYVAGESVTWFPGDESGAVVGGHFFSHIYANSGSYNVCAFYTTPGCPQGVELCTTIFVEPCQQTCNELVLGIDSYVNNGGTPWLVYNISSANNQEFSASGEVTYNAEDPFYDIALCIPDGCYYLTIDNNNPITIGQGLDLFLSNSEQNYLSNYEVVYQDNISFTILFSVNGDCLVDEVCPTEITITPANCHQYIFEVNEWGNSLYGDILWNFGDNEGYGQNEFLHMYMEPGQYEVCVEGTTDMCPSGFSLCTPLNVEACGDENGDGCPDYIWAYQVNDCGLWHFEAGLTDAVNQTAVWNWGDGTYSDGSTVINHQFETDGLYVVTLTYSSNNCENISINYTLEANACETPDCPQAIWSGEGDICGMMQFEAGSFVEGEEFIWYFGDGTSAEGGHFITHQYTEGGTYNVCCVLSNINCTGYQLCTEITVENCETPCNNIIVGIDSYVNEGGTPWLVYSITSADGGGFATSGEVTYSEADPFFDTPVCLPDGCYYLTVDNNNNITLGQGLNVFITSNGNSLLENSEIIYQDDISFTILFGVNTDCSTSSNCEASFNPIYTNTAGHIEFQNTSVYDGTASFIWTYGNEQTSDGQSGNVWYQQNGVYEVCLTVTTDNCADTYCFPVSVQNMETGCAGTMVVMTITSETEMNVTDLVALELESHDIPVELWTLPVTNGFTATYEMCVPDGCYTINMSTETPLQADNVTVTVAIENEVIDVIEFVNNSSSATAEVGVNSDCIIQVENTQEEQWQVYPNPANDQLTIASYSGKEISSISLYDLRGSLVKLMNVQSNMITLNVDDIASGLYILRINGEDFANSHRIEIQH